MDDSQRNIIKRFMSNERKVMDDEMESGIRGEYERGLWGQESKEERVVRKRETR